MFRCVYSATYSAVLFSHPFLVFILYLAFCLTNVPNYIFNWILIASRIYDFYIPFCVDVHVHNK